MLRNGYILVLNFGTGLPDGTGFIVWSHYTWPWVKRRFNLGVRCVGTCCWLLASGPQQGSQQQPLPQPSLAAFLATRSAHPHHLSPLTVHLLTFITNPQMRLPTLQGEQMKCEDHTSFQSKKLSSGIFALQNLKKELFDQNKHFY